MKRLLLPTPFLLSVLLLLVGVVARARADDPPATTLPAGTPPAATAPSGEVTLPAGAASQVVGLFMQSCVRFALDPAGVRGWALHAGLKLLPPEGQQAFLYGLPGQVFDASTKDGKLVMISENSGACSTMAESASGAAVVKVLEQVMQLAHIDLTMTHEDDDKVEKALHHREYTAASNGRQWEMLVSTVKGTAPGEVMLTTSP
jgi:hypothetical protein